MLLFLPTPPPVVTLPAPLDPPRLRVDPPGEVDLGSLGPTERRAQAYRIRNRSDRPIALRLLDVPPGVRVEGPALEAPLAPGAEAPLRLVFDAAGLEGFQARDVRIGTDDPRQGRYHLPVRAQVRPDLAVDGTDRDLGTFLAHESPRCVFSFRRESGAPAGLRLAEAPPPHLEPDLAETGGSAQLGFTFRADRVPAGVRRGVDRLRVATAAPLQPAFELTVAWRFRPAVDATPPRVVFQDPARRSRVLRLEAADGGRPSIASLQVIGAGFRVVPLRGGRLRVLRVGETPGRALLRLGFRDRPGVLEVPLAYLPCRPLKSGAPPPGRRPPASG
ncbi:hypothetical protein [Mesoterricola sediminis]|uniref:DUF1573 domain-containing protein n=1 Tax=Mesoterricola sediminis TaxID=2927980 RepID=A0AA48GZM5_9BACT|nr:hypothetical protein [Mesoterricola sediminis]BDU78550.1 hypothetical protein METESE_35080 [Mesoterricola sediminis]